MQVFKERLGLILEREDEMACMVDGCNFLLKAVRIVFMECLLKNYQIIEEHIMNNSFLIIPSSLYFCRCVTKHLHTRTAT